MDIKHHRLIIYIIRQCQRKPKKMIIFCSSSPWSRFETNCPNPEDQKSPLQCKEVEHSKQSCNFLHFSFFQKVFGIEGAIYLTFLSNHCDSASWVGLQNEFYSKLMKTQLIYSSKEGANSTKLSSSVFHS